jgi:hypothetical protein
VGAVAQEEVVAVPGSAHLGCCRPRCNLG